MITLQVQFDSQVQDKVGGSTGLTVTATTVREALYQVARQYPALRLFNCEGEMRSVYQVRCDGALASLDAAVQEGNVVLLSLGAAA